MKVATDGNLGSSCGALEKLAESISEVADACVPRETILKTDKSRTEGNRHRAGAKVRCSPVTPV